MHHAEIIADERQPSVVALGDQSQTTGQWLISPASHVIVSVSPGTATFRLTVKSAGTYALWLGGDFGRGFGVSVDGRAVGSVHDALAAINGDVPVTNLDLGAGAHTVVLAYRGHDLAPGGGDQLATTLSAVVLQPPAARSGHLATLSAANAMSLCGQSVDWIEVAVPQPRA